jgi:SAM-dependent methyltransferase
MEYLQLATYFILVILALALTITYFLVFLYPLIGGAPYVPTDMAVVKEIIRLAEVQPSQKAADLGSGDGRLVIALAQAGALATGYEISPLLVLWSKYKAVKAKITGNGKAEIIRKSFWDVNFENFDIIILYQLPYVMKRLDSKLQKELKPGAKVICNGFTLPNWKAHLQKEKIYVYVKGDSSLKGGEKI